ncbi:MAG: hypothetical protein Tsb0013_18900 [Phycisphaerales bacterium]
MPQAIAAAAAAIQAEPPAHERAEPWTITIEELRLESRPLRKEQLEERVNAWLDILQTKVRERVRLDIAATQDEYADIKTDLVRQSGEVQAQVNAIESRATLLIDMLADRGGDVKQYRDYVANATGQEIDWFDPDVVMTWLTSPTGGVAIGLNIVRFLGVLIAFWIAARIIGGVVRGAMGRVAKGQSDLLKNVVSSTVRRLILIVGFVVALGQLGVNIGPLVAAIGAAGLVIGLALQGVLSNFASGLLILVNRPYDVGDVITAGGVTGKVERMTLVNTKILTFDNQIMHVPNDAIWSGVITNITGLATRRVDLVFGIGYADDFEKAERIIAEIVASHPKVLQDPAPTIKLHELADSSVNFIVRPWSKKEDYWDVYWDITKQIKARFDAEGIGIPFPQRDIHLPGPVEVVVKNA